MGTIKSPDTIKLALNMGEAFLVPFDFEETAQEILTLRGTISDPFVTTVSTFCDNLRSAYSAATLPYSLAHSKASALHLQRLTLAERIRSLKDDHPSTSDAERNAAADARAKERFAEFASSDIGLDAIIADLSRTLVDFLNTPAGSDTARQLLYQAILGIWSALEIIARDGLAIKINGKPRLAQKLLDDPAAKKAFELPRFSIDDLISAQFDLSRKMGDVLLGARDFSDLRIIRTAYKALAGDSSVAQVLGDDSLWHLNQARHLIAHRGGVIDARYRQQTGCSESIGTKLAISPAKIEKYFAAVAQTANVLIKFLDKLEIDGQ
ncbi:Uncharacterised protein [Burkholderia pseudomallei]|nr:Uncharacterised protein [Burkholderia pseudomallei]